MHLIKYLISHLWGTSAGPKYPRLLAQSPEQPYPTAAGKLWSIAGFLNLPQLFLHGKPRFLQEECLAWAIHTKQMEKSHSGRNQKNCVSLQFSMLPDLLLRKALQCCAKYANWVFWFWPFRAVSFPGEMLVWQSGSWNTLWFLSPPTCRNGYTFSRNDKHIQEQITTVTASIATFGWKRQHKTPYFSQHCINYEKSRELSGDQDLPTWVLVEIQG